MFEKKIFFRPAGGNICSQDGRLRNSCYLTQVTYLFINTSYAMVDQTGFFAHLYSPQANRGGQKCGMPRCCRRNICIVCLHIGSVLFQSKGNAVLQGTERNKIAKFNPQANQSLSYFGTNTSQDNFGS